MKKFIFISLLVIPFCKAAEEPQQIEEAADPYASWRRATQHLSDADLQSINVEYHLGLDDREITALPENLNIPYVGELRLQNNLIRALPKEFNLRRLQLLDLSENELDYVDPAIIQKLPRLRLLNLRGNKRLTQENVDALKEEAAARTGEYYLRILANSDLPTNIKGSEE